MNLIRTAGRMMLASYFVFNGTKQALNPKPLVSDAEPVADKIVPLLKKAAPAPVAGFIPTDTKQLVRLNGAMMALGGVGMGLGIGRRAGASMVAAGMLPHVMAVNPNGGANGLEKDDNRRHFVRNLALLGGALVASQDTQGKPSLSWRAGNVAGRLGRKADKKINELNPAAETLSKKARKQLDKAQKAAAKQARQLEKRAAKARKKGDLAELLP